MPETEQFQEWYCCCKRPQCPGKFPSRNLLDIHLQTDGKGASVQDLLERCDLKNAGIRLD